VEEAIKSHEKALAIKPDFVEALNNLGIALQKTKRVDQAFDVYQKALSLNPGLTDAYNNLGLLYQEKDKMGKAIENFEKAFELDPGFTKAYCNLAELFERTNQLEKARENVEIALSINEVHPFANCILAILLRREEKYQDALNVLLKMDFPENDREIAHRIHYETGKIYDLLNEGGKAFHNFSKANEFKKQIYDPESSKKNEFMNYIQKHHDFYTTIQVRAGSASRDNIRLSPAFMVGFPRSGTTLLDQIIDSHARINVIEENPVLNSVIDVIAISAKGYPDALTDLSNHNIEALRNKYFKSLSQYDGSSGEMILVDKLPLNIIFAGLIHQLFPDAKIIVSLRHPYDVVLSNFMQDYKINEAMANFFTIEDAAMLYDKVMGLWVHYKNNLPIDYHEIKYENLVGNFEFETKQIFKFLDLEWNESVLEFDQHARKRAHIQTPSYHQVTRPIYKTARYRWKRYVDQFAPVAAILSPYIKSFGYKGV